MLRIYEWLIEQEQQLVKKQSLIEAQQRQISAQQEEIEQLKDSLEKLKNRDSHAQFRSSFIGSTEKAQRQKETEKRKKTWSIVQSSRENPQWIWYSRSSNHFGAGKLSGLWKFFRVTRRSKARKSSR